MEFQRLTPHDDLAIEFMEVRHEVGAGDPEAYHHRGREYGLVLTGRLLVEVGFGKYVLEPGWSIAFDSSNPHRVINIGDEPASAVWVVVAGPGLEPETSLEPRPAPEPIPGSRYI